MAKVTYSANEAKTHFGKLLRQVRAGQRVVITYRGCEVAEIRPVDSSLALAERILVAEERGVVARSAASRGRWYPLVRRSGGLARFLASRE